jgi:hypothetical protein
MSRRREHEGSTAFYPRRHARHQDPRGRKNSGGIGAVTQIRCGRSVIGAAKWVAGGMLGFWSRTKRDSPTFSVGQLKRAPEAHG